MENQGKEGIGTSEAAGAMWRGPVKRALQCYQRHLQQQQLTTLRPATVAGELALVGELLRLLGGA